MNPTNGKGSAVRPYDPKKFLENFDNIFKKNQETEHNNCGTPDCCMQCDTASLGEEQQIPLDKE